ncbi:proline-rich proteoglycan 2-like [Onychomys torridus]|uniref:proline-rich proteoglycan 2-like n=1 Tax=Onychomys torridus TaxID=38674 RepID=UPI00167F7770|nr:proline-rich proteoglycan 2-like [Onychomys torridus]
MSGREEGRAERGPPAEAEAEGSKQPPLPAPLTPRSSTGGPRLRIPSHDRRAGPGWRRPGGRPPRDGVARPSASSREERAGGPHPPQPAPGRPPKFLSPRGSWRCPVTCRGRRRDAAWEM